MDQSFEGARLQPLEGGKVDLVCVSLFLFSFWHTSCDGFFSRQTKPLYGRYFFATAGYLFSEITHTPSNVSSES